MYVNTVESLWASDKPNSVIEATIQTNLFRIIETQYLLVIPTLYCYCADMHVSRQYSRFENHVELFQIVYEPKFVFYDSENCELTYCDTFRPRAH